VSANDGAVEKRADVIDLDVELQLLEQPLPDATCRPAAEPVVDGLPRPVPLGNVTPGGARLHAPDDRVDELAVAALRRRATPGWDERLNQLPLRFAELVSVHTQR